MAVEPFRFRPLTVADLLDESFRVYRANFAVLAAIAIATYLPQVAILLASGTQDIYTSAFQAIQHPGPPPTDGSIPGYNPLRGLITLLNYPVQLAVAPFEYGAPILAATWTLLGYRVSLEGAIRGLLRFFWPTVLVLLLVIALAATVIALQQRADARHQAIAPALDGDFQGLQVFDYPAGELAWGGSPTCDSDLLGALEPAEVQVLEAVDEVGGLVAQLLDHLDQPQRVG